MADVPHASTAPPDRSGTDGWERTLRVLSVAFVSGLVVLGLVGILGVRTGTARNSANGYTISVTHASVTRAGLATPFSVAVASDDGSPLPAEITTRIDAGYLEMFDENGLDPTPTSSYQTREWTWWTFEVPEGHRDFEVSFDARLEPAVQWGRAGSATLELAGDRVVTAEFTTRVIP